MMALDTNIEFVFYTRLINLRVNLFVGGTAIFMNNIVYIEISTMYNAVEITTQDKH